VTDTPVTLTLCGGRAAALPQAAWLRDPSRSRLLCSEREARMAQSSPTYKVSPNSSAGDWHREVQTGPKVIAHGLAPNDVKARVEAMVAAVSYVDRSAKDLKRPRS
jgi:predicted nucleic acid-binding Zn ribbon protein